MKRETSTLTFAKTSENAAARHLTRYVIATRLFPIVDRCWYRISLHTLVVLICSIKSVHQSRKPVPHCLKFCHGAHLHRMAGTLVLQASSLMMILKIKRASPSSLHFRILVRTTTKKHSFHCHKILVIVANCRNWLW